MTREFDPKKSYLAVKANEKMIAYVGFHIHLEAHREKKEGVVKISSFQRAYGGGYLTLTFIVDKGPDETLFEQLGQLCDSVLPGSGALPLAQLELCVSSVLVPSIAYPGPPACNQGSKHHRHGDHPPDRRLRPPGDRFR